MKRERVLYPLVGIALAAIALACAASAGATSPPTPPWMHGFQRILGQAYKGQAMAVPPTGPKGTAGKNVWNVACLQQIPDCAHASAAVIDAAKAIGWNLTTVDNKNDPQVTAQYIQQAINAKADGIILTGIDCPAVKNALISAQQAKIPVISIGAADCPDQTLFAGYGLIAGREFIRGQVDVWNPDRIAWGVVQTKGKMKLIAADITDLAVAHEGTTHGLQVLKKCKTCQVVDVIKLSVRDLPQIGQLLAVSLQKHPDANAFYPWNGSALTLGAKNAIERAGRSKNLWVLSGSCQDGEPALMKAGWKMGCVGLSLDWAAWTAVDVMNRVFSGQTWAQIPKYGSGLQALDKTHNEPTGDSWVPPLDYRSLFTKLWTTGSSK